MKNKSREKSNDVLKFLLSIFFVFLLMAFIVFVFLSISGNKEINPFQGALYTILFCVGFSVLIVVFLIFLYLIFCIFNYIAEKNIQVTKLSKVDFVNNKQLYREIIKKYSPVLLAYIDKMRFDYDISVVAGLLSLKNKGYIETYEDKLEIIKYDFFNLNMPERYLIENIRNGKVENVNQLENIVFEEGKRKGLLISNEKWIGMFPRGMKNLFIFTAIYFFIVFPILEDVISLFNNAIILKNVMPIIVFLAYIYVCLYAMKSQENLYDRSKRAEELNQKLEGLKNYINEYSLLKDKTSEDIILWEDYLIYSVIFNQNNDIIEEYKKYY